MQRICAQEREHARVRACGHKRVTARVFVCVCVREKLSKIPAVMPRGVKKENLPSKMCVVCNRPFTWRKKWERCWDEVQTCSDRCKNERKRNKKRSNQAEVESGEKTSTCSEGSKKVDDPAFPGRRGLNSFSRKPIHVVNVRQLHQAVRAIRIFT